MDVLLVNWKLLSVFFLLASLSGEFFGSPGLAFQDHLPSGISRPDSYPASPGDFDPTFGVGGVAHDISSSAQSVAIQGDGRIVTVGGESGNFKIVRYLTNGSLDTSFGSGAIVTSDFGGTDSATCVALQTDGKIIVGGYIADGNGVSDFAILRLNPNGSPDNSFGTSGKVITQVGNSISDSDWLQSIAIQSDSKIVAGGYTIAPGIATDFGVVRYETNGSLDGAFGNGGKVITDIGGRTDNCYKVLVQPDGKIVAVGSANNATDSDLAVVRYDSNGTLDPGFGSNGKVTTQIGNLNDTGRSAVIQTDGKIIVCGVSRGNVGVDNFAIVRYNANGSLDAGFGNNGIVVTESGDSTNLRANSVAIQPDGKIVLGGSKTPTAAAAFGALARFSPSGILDITFGSGGLVFSSIGGGTAIYRGIAIQSDGKIVGAGLFNAGSGDKCLVARYFGDTVLIPVRSPFDFDGDGKSDISIYRPSLGQWWLNRSTDGVIAHTFGNSSDKITPGDFTGDGKTDVAIYRPSEGAWYVLRSEDYTFYSFPFGNSTDTPVPADYDGDGKSDAAVFRASNSTWYIQRSSGGTTIEGFGSPGDLPVPADYDGDGKADIAIYRPSLGQWWLNRSTAGVIAVTFGNSTDKPVRGDYTGDGKSDIAIWRPSLGEWFILRSEDYSFYSFPFGSNGDTPVPGDYDGDGKTDAAVFRASTGTWYLNRSTAGVLIQGFGLPTDLPVPAAFVP